MKPKPFWLLNHFTIPLFLGISFRVHVRPGRRAIGAVCRLIDFLGKGSETCAPVGNEAKRPRSFGQVSIYIIWTRIGAPSRSAGLGLADPASPVATWLRCLRVPAGDISGRIRSILRRPIFRKSVFRRAL